MNDDAQRDALVTFDVMRQKSIHDMMTIFFFGVGVWEYLITLPWEIRLYLSSRITWLKLLFTLTRLFAFAAIIVATLTKVMFGESFIDRRWKKDLLTTLIPLF